MIFRNTNPYRGTNPYEEALRRQEESARGVPINHLGLGQLKITRPPEVNIEIANDGNYKLYTNAEGTRFIAGCRDFTREEALEHWRKRFFSLNLRSPESARAFLFFNAISDFKGEKMNKQQAMKELKDIINQFVEQKERLDKDMKEAEEKYQRLKAIIDAPERGRFKPDMHKDYYYLDDSGNIEADEWWDYDCDKFRYSVGNCYSTYKEAERARDKQLALVKLQDLADELNEPALNWSDSQQGKFEICYDHDTKTVEVHDYVFSVQCQGAIYFTSRKAAKTAISRLTQKEISLIFDLNN